MDELRTLLEKVITTEFFKSELFDNEELPQAQKAAAAVLGMEDDELNHWFIDVVNELVGREFQKLAKERRKTERAEEEAAAQKFRTRLVTGDLA